MTICIAAIGTYPDGGKEKEAIVFSTDHMIGVLNSQFEHAIEKYRCINDSCVAMFASNNALLFDEIISRINKTTPTSQICQNINQAMVQLRLEKIEREILKVYDVDWTFVKSIIDKQLMNVHTDQMLSKISTYSLMSQVLLIGFENDEAQIYEITESGWANLRSLNFGIVGSGFPQASNTLLFQKHSKKDTLETALYNVYKAKRNSEVSQGVGKETEILILFNKKGAKKLLEKHINTLKDIYEREMRTAKGEKALSEILSEIK